MFITCSRTDVMNTPVQSASYRCASRPEIRESKARLVQLILTCITLAMALHRSTSIPLYCPLSMYWLGGTEKSAARLRVPGCLSPRLAAVEPVLDEDELAEEPLPELQA